MMRSFEKRYGSPQISMLLPDSDAEDDLKT
ncbi:hypothetical protein APED_03170 [Acanthopleuribacter pedis]